MEFIQLTFITESNEQNEILIALLSDVGFEGFEEKEPGLTATISSVSFDEAQANEISRQLNIPFTREKIEQQNWNAIWEAGFHPVIVPGFCTVRASFHPHAEDTPYEVIITPKMSFGTGHHATTFLMMESMRKIDFSGKKVLDFGTGTGILAILAQKLGSIDVFGVDNDEWSIENAVENAMINHSNITLKLGTLDDVPSGSYSIILANINRNILLHYMKDMNAKLEVNGHLLLSGILEDDEAIITKSANDAGLKHISQQASNGWLCMTFIKE